MSSLFPHWAAILLTIVVTGNQIQNAIGSESNKDYLDYDSDEEDLVTDHYSNEPSYVREIRKYRKLGVDYELQPVPIPIYYHVHVPKPYFNKKYKYPFESTFKPYIYSKSKPYFDEDFKTEGMSPTNDSESSSPSSKLSPRESNYKSRIHYDKYSRPFSVKNYPIDYKPHPIPFKDMDPEFTTPLPPPPPPPTKRRAPVSSVPTSRRPILTVKKPTEKFGIRNRKADHNMQYRPLKETTTGGNSPRIDTKNLPNHQYTGSTKSPPPRYQKGPAEKENQRIYQSPSNQERSQQYKQSTKSPPRRYQKDRSESEDQRIYQSRSNQGRSQQYKESTKSPPRRHKKDPTESEDPRMYQSPSNKGRSQQYRESTKSPPRRYQKDPIESEDQRMYESPSNEGRSQKYKESTKSPRGRYQTRPAEDEDQGKYHFPSEQGRSQQYPPRTSAKSPQLHHNHPEPYTDNGGSKSRPSSRQRPPLSRHPSESISEKPYPKQTDGMATKQGFGNDKGSFSDIATYDNPFARENNGERKRSFTKPPPHSRTELRKEESSEEEDNSRGPPSPTRHPRTKVQYDDDDEDYDATDESSYTPKKQPQNKVYKKYQERLPDQTGHGQRDRKQNYSPSDEHHSSTPSTRSDYRNTYSSPAPTRKYKKSHDRTYVEYSPREERDYDDRPKSGSTSADDAEDGGRNEKPVPRRYVPSKRYYERVDRSESDSAEDSSEEEPFTEEPAAEGEPRSRVKRHNTQPKSWQRVVNESHIMTISSSNPSVLKIFKAMKIGTSDEGIILLDTRVTKDKEGQVKQILTKSIPLLKRTKKIVPTCAGSSSLDYCLTDPEYPREKVLEALQKNTGQWRSLLNIRPGSDKIQRRYIVQNGTITSGCKSTNSWIFPLRAKDVDGSWRVIANVDEFKQSVSLELCSKENEVCSSNHGVCKQQRVERHLVTLSSNNELSLKTFKFPSYCSCVKATA